jgi:signal transduction histidine kinase
MRHVRGSGTGPWGLVAAAIVTLLVVIGTVGVIGVNENARVKDASKRAIQYDVAVAGAGDNLRVAVLDLRYNHRNIVFSGPTEQTIADFDAAYATLLNEIDRLDQIGIAQLDVTQPDVIRQRAQEYHDAFRPRIVLFTSDPVAFNAASNAGLAQIDELESYAQQIEDAGEQLTNQSLTRVEHAAARERIILILLLSGVALVGASMAVSAGRILHQLRESNAHEQEAGRQLAAALQAKSDFIADASHELRTPLTLIRGNAEIALSAGDSPIGNQVLTEILAESKRMSRLVDDLLFLARSDAGISLVEREYVPIRWLLSRLTGPAEAMARHHGATMVASLAGEGHVEVDPERIQQAVLILVDNAARVSPADAPVELRSQVGDGCLAIDVIDRGPGLPAGEQERIFERFYQVGPGRTRQQGSAGLGLSIAKSIVDAHHGRIEIDSTPGKGTRVAIHLPLSQEAA